MFIKAYKVWVRGDKEISTVVHALSAGKAKAEYWRHLDMDFLPYTAIRCKKLADEPVECPSVQALARARHMQFICNAISPAQTVATLRFIS